MEVDDKKQHMIVNEVDLDFILKTYIRAYRFKNDNKLPKKIIIKSSRDYVELSEPQWAEVQGKKVKYEFGGFGKAPKKQPRATASAIRKKTYRPKEKVNDLN